jgi:hypothetical protein
MWAYVKSILYQSPITGTDDVKKRITDAIMTVHGCHALHNTARA